MGGCRWRYILGRRGWIHIYYGWVEISGYECRYILGSWGEWTSFMASWGWLEVYFGWVGVGWTFFMGGWGWMEVGRGIFWVGWVGASFSWMGRDGL